MSGPSVEKVAGRTFRTTTETHCAHTWGEGSNRCVACGQTLTFAAGEDAGLREQVKALAERLDAEADGICPVGVYDKKDKAWRVAHVRRRVAEDLRGLLTDPTRPEAPMPDAERDALRLAEESFRHSWDMSDERLIDGAWVAGLCCECGAFVPYGQEVAHVAAALAPLIDGAKAEAWDDGHDCCTYPICRANPHRVPSPVEKGQADA